MFGNLAQATEDISRMQGFLKEMCFDQIFFDENPSYGDIEGHMGDLKKILRKGQKRDQKTLLFVYYSGHGVMVSDTHIVINSSEGHERFFPLE